MMNKKGFTLIELLVVIIIVGILASVSVPMMRGNLTRARCSEAVAALGAIRTQMRLVLAEYNAYTGSTTSPVTTGAVIGNVPNFQTGDLNGRYFLDADYTITVGTNTFTAKATGANSGGASGQNMSSVIVTIDENGEILQ